MAEQVKEKRVATTFNMRPSVAASIKRAAHEEYKSISQWLEDVALAALPKRKVAK